MLLVIFDSACLYSTQVMKREVVWTVSLTAVNLSDSVCPVPPNGDVSDLMHHPEAMRHISLRPLVFNFLPIAGDAGRDKMKLKN